MGVTKVKNSVANIERSTINMAAMCVNPLDCIPSLVYFSTLATHNKGLESSCKITIRSDDPQVVFSQNILGATSFQIAGRSAVRLAGRCAGRSASHLARKSGRQIGPGNLGGRLPAPKLLGVCRLHRGDCQFVGA